FAKSLAALKPGGIMALVTSRFTLDKQNTAFREHLAAQADFLGAVRLPSDAFKREGTAVVADILFFRKRGEGEPARHADPSWLHVTPVTIDGRRIIINCYMLSHPHMILGDFSTKNRLYEDGYSLVSKGNLSEQLHAAIERLPEKVFTAARS